jgi:hypothetical protein
MEVVGSRDWEIAQGRGYSPAKLKIKCPALSIGLASKLSVGSVVGTCRVRGKRLLRSWEPGIKRMSRGGHAAQKQWILSICTQYLPGGCNGCGGSGRGVWGRVYTAVRVVSLV